MFCYILRVMGGHGQAAERSGRQDEAWRPEQEAPGT